VNNKIEKSVLMSLSTLELIQACAKVPCFSTYEDRIHPLIQSLVDRCPQATLIPVPRHNLLIKVEGRNDVPPVALSAHLDKIDHFIDEGTPEQPPEILPVHVDAHEITGQMDDTVGLGMALSLMFQSAEENFPTLYLLFSEMEESFGLKRHPERLVNNGEGLYSGIGAERLAAYVQAHLPLPSRVITIDTTPLFRGERGIALYAKHWEKNGLEASPALVESTEALETLVVSLNPEVRLTNNTNDYLNYGRCFNQSLQATPIPCVAVEPAIYPYHQKDERVFLSDIAQTEAIVKALIQL
jgi:hypothetical protein